MHTPEQIKDAIKNISDYTSEQLIDMQKIISSMTSAKEKKTYDGLPKAIEKERRKRGEIKMITSKPMAAKLPAGGLNADDYEAVEVVHDTN